jgi:peptidoglycan/LPS O-acetylase OafA/YrhL
MRIHTWSLAVEEHFYLILPFVLLVLFKLRKHKVDTIPAVPWLTLILIVFCTSLRLVEYSVYPANERWNLLYATHLRIDGLFWGVLLSYLYYFKSRHLENVARYRGTLLSVGLALSLIPVFALEQSWFMPTIGLTFLYVGYGMLLICLLYTPVGSGRLGKVLASGPSRLIGYVGLFSYSIYLWHIDLGRNLVNKLIAREFFIALPGELTWVAVTGLYLAGACIGGIALGKLIELPFLALRDRMFPSGTNEIPRE